MARKQPRIGQASSSSRRSKGAGRSSSRSTGRSSSRRSRKDIFNIIRSTLRKRFPNDTVDVSDGYKDNIHVLVVSREFDEMDESAKQDLVWNLIDGSDLTEEEKGLISLVLPLSPAQLK